jgi:hypothetical protein
MLVTPLSRFIYRRNSASLLFAGIQEHLLLDVARGANANNGGEEYVKFHIYVVTDLSKL